MLNVLELSTRLGFNQVRQLAIDYIQSTFIETRDMGRSECVHFGRIGFVEGWVLRGYAKMVCGTERVLDEELEVIGTTASSKLWPLREEFRRFHRRLTKEYIRGRIEEKFADELGILRQEAEARRVRAREESEPVPEVLRIEGRVQQPDNDLAIRLHWVLVDSGSFEMDEAGQPRPVTHSTDLDESGIFVRSLR